MDLDVDQATRNYICANHLVAIHFPYDVNGDLPDDKDNDSLDPADHPMNGARAVGALLDLSVYGGYVYAEYSRSESSVLRACGIVLPGTPIIHFTGKWGSTNGNLARDADLKTLKMVHVNMYPPKIPDPPARGTLSQWPSVGTRVSDMFKGVVIDR
jgi:hypothetical protein